LDLLVSIEVPPSVDQLKQVLEQPLSAAAETLGIFALGIEPTRTTGEFPKLAVTSGARVLFTIDLTRISSVIRSELVEFPLALDSVEYIVVPVPSRDLQLLFKAEAFLKRRFLKARDAFDIKLLRDSGAKLDETLKAHLVDGAASELLEDPDFITSRIDLVNSRTCKPELQPYLPKDIYEELERTDFETLRETLRQLFSEWL
jgi:hypothetical protein